MKISKRPRAHKVLLLFSPGNRPEHQVGTESIVFSWAGQSPRRQRSVRCEKEEDRRSLVRKINWPTHGKQMRGPHYKSAGKQHPWRTKSRRENMVVSQGSQETCPSKAWWRTLRLNLADKKSVLVSTSEILLQSFLNQWREIWGGNCRPNYT